MVGLFFPERWEKRRILILMHWVNIGAPLLIGPSKVLHLPNDPGLIGVGLFLGGTTRSLFAAYIIAEGVKGGVAQYAGQQERVGDLMSSFY